VVAALQPPVAGLVAGRAVHPVAAAAAAGVPPAAAHVGAAALAAEGLLALHRAGGLAALAALLTLLAAHSGARPGVAPLVAGVHAATEQLATGLTAGRHHDIARSVRQLLLATGAGLGPRQLAATAGAGVAHLGAAVPPAVQKFAAHAGALEGQWGKGQGRGT
jgi:hypothetical protein